VVSRLGKEPGDGGGQAGLCGMVLGMTSVLDPIAIIAREADQLLWSTYDASLEGACANLPSPLMFVPLRDDDPDQAANLRISEQEARFAFVHEVIRHGGLRYCMERPTRERYRQTGRANSRGSFDLGVFTREGAHLANMEFKYGGISSLAKSTLRVSKDIEKLLRDPGPAVHVHLLEAVDNKTIPRILDVIARSGVDVVRRYAVLPKPILIHLTVLRQHFSIQGLFSTDLFQGEVEQAVEALHVDYVVGREAILDHHASGAWHFEFPR
jgi:hypothetical protein